MIGPVMERLRESDTHLRSGLGAVVTVPHEHAVGVGILCQDRRPLGAVALHRGAELREVHLVFLDLGDATAAQDDQVGRVGADGVARRVEDRTVGTRYGGLELFR